MDGGREASVDELLDTIRYNDFNVTLSGGDPLYHPKEVAELCRRIKQELGKTVWCFTGFTWDEIQADPALQLPLQWIDVVVEGRSCASAAAPTSASSTLPHQKGKQFRWN